ncbi:MAG: M48 family metallopeptidase [Sedimentisphaerales bacterium]|nr:M48 family metallopeptidase [Sedimentisphaerales bacterium]
MKTLLKTKLYVLLGLLFVLSGCSRVEITGRRQFNLVPDSMMNSMSFKNYGEFISQNKLSTNAEKTLMVKRVGERIQKAVEKYCEEKGVQDKIAGYEWEFNLVEDPNVNAWCMPGGKVVVYTGLLPITQTEAGLAVVVGHEIAHAFAKHGSERMTQGLIVDMGSMALSKALEERPEETKNLFMTSYGIGSKVGILLPYSRVHENEADHLGLIFMAMAGYDPQEAAVFWKRMAAAKKGSQTLEILSTHPADETRIRNIEKLLPDAMKYYKQQ